MSAVKVIRALLLAHAPVTSIVGKKVFAGVIDQGVALPALAVREISRSERKTASLNESTVMVTSRVQVSVLANTYPELKALLQATKLSAGSHTGTIAGVSVRAVTREAVGPEMSNDDAKIFEQSRDFMVVFQESN